MSTNFTDPLARLASDLLDELADIFVGRASTLRDGTEHAGVELPRDLYAHTGAQTEWWYYTGHMQTSAGRRIGVSFKDAGEASRYFSYTRMAAHGRITWRGETEACNGAAWLDREFGTWRTTEKQQGWDWFSVQLATGAEVMVYHLRDRKGRPS